MARSSRLKGKPNHDRRDIDFAIRQMGVMRGLVSSLQARAMAVAEYSGEIDLAQSEEPGEAQVGVGMWLLVLDMQRAHELLHETTNGLRRLAGRPEVQIPESYSAVKRVTDRTTAEVRQAMAATEGSGK